MNCSVSFDLLSVFETVHTFLFDYLLVCQFKHTMMEKKQNYLMLKKAKEVFKKMQVLPNNTTLSLDSFPRVP